METMMDTSLRKNKINKTWTPKQNIWELKRTEEIVAYITTRNQKHEEDKGEQH
jgi:hypothetical protein